MARRAIVSADGEPIGRLLRVADDHIELEPGPGVESRAVGLDWIASIDGDVIRLSVTTAQARLRWSAANEAF
jgi:hypothetical protein